MDKTEIIEYLAKVTASCNTLQQLQTILQWRDNSPRLQEISECIYAMVMTSSKRLIMELNTKKPRKQTIREYTKGK